MYTLRGFTWRKIRSLSAGFSRIKAEDRPVLPFVAESHPTTDPAIAMNRTIGLTQENRWQNTVSTNQRLDLTEGDAHPASSTSNVSDPETESVSTQTIEITREVQWRSVILDPLDRRQKPRRSRRDATATSKSRIAMNSREDRPPEYCDVPSVRICPSAPAILILPTEVSKDKPRHSSGRLSASANSLDILYREIADQLWDTNRRRRGSTGQSSRERHLNRK